MTNNFYDLIFISSIDLRAISREIFAKNYIIIYFKFLCFRDMALGQKNKLTAAYNFSILLLFDKINQRRWNVFRYLVGKYLRLSRFFSNVKINSYHDRHAVCNGVSPSLQTMAVPNCRPITLCQAYIRAYQSCGSFQIIIKSSLIHLELNLFCILLY